MQKACVAAGFGFYRDGRADGVTIALCAAQTECNRRRQIVHHVLQNAQLGSVAIFEEHFLASVMIEIGESEGAAIFEEVESHRAGDIGERSVPIVRVENISLETAPGTVGADEFVDRVPSLLVFV